MTRPEKEVLVNLSLGGPRHRESSGQPMVASSRLKSFLFNSVILLDFIHKTILILGASINGLVFK